MLNVWRIAFYFFIGVVSLRSSKCAISDTCLEPSGQDCTWYRECLAYNYNCSDSPYEYALSYGEKYCEIFSSKASQFSVDGQKWIRNVKKCLQEKLANRLKVSDNLSCKEIRHYAFASHAACYTKPLGDKGICELKLSDWWNVLTIIWTQFIPFYSKELFESINGAIQVLFSCVGIHSLSGQE